MVRWPQLHPVKGGGDWRRGNVSQKLRRREEVAVKSQIRLHNPLQPDIRTEVWQPSSYGAPLSNCEIRYCDRR